MIEYDKLNNDIKVILELLNKNGKGVLVGGAVRDFLFKLVPKDYDFATNISYDKLKVIFKDYSPTEIGKHFGIINIKFGERKYDIAKFRIDLGTPSNRKKQKIKFTSNLILDLQRRDFTINSIAYDGNKLIYGNQWCQHDIENRILRFMGDPMTRIKEDPLRLFRGIRFVCTKNLNPKYLLELSNENLDIIENISMERVKEEFDKILVSDSVEVALELFKKLKLWKYLSFKINELINLNKKNSLGLSEYSEIITLVKSVENKKHLRLACLLQNIDIDSGRVFLNKLKYSKKSIYIISKLIDNYHVGIELNSHLSVKKVIKNIGHENVKNYIDLLKANIKVGKENFSTLVNFEKNYIEILKNKEPIELKDLEINGFDLIKFGIDRKEIGKKLEFLLNLVFENPNLNTKEKLLEICKKN
ncbi:MAG: CCA tRNA nucleotidyltransferase [Fusobacteriaceae bacterium]